MIRTTITALLIAGASFAGPIEYPETETVDVTDEYHGMTVSDPYRWLEASVHDEPRVRDWVKRQNAVTFDYLESLDQREQFRERMTNMLRYERYSSPSNVAGTYYFSKNDGLQNHSVLYRIDSLDDPTPEVVIDPNTFSDDGTVAMAGTYFTDDGRFMAYMIQEGGSDWRTIKVRDMKTLTDLPDTIEWAKFTAVSWLPDNSGFFYSRFDAPQEGEAFVAKNMNQKMYFHRLGTPQDQDVLVYERPDEPEWGIYGSVTEDGRYLAIYISTGATTQNRFFYRDLKSPYAAPIRLIDEFVADFTLIGNDGKHFYFRTDYNAPKGRVIRVDIDNPEKDNWVEIIAERETTLRWVNWVGGQFVCGYLEDAYNKVKIHSVSGAFVREVALPGIGSAGGFGGKKTDFDVFYSFSSYAVPPSQYRYNMLTGESELFRVAGVDFDPSPFITEQVFFSSKDGTRVPMFITRHIDTEFDGTNPTILYGYGGFNIPLTPSFSTSTAVWLEAGGIYAVANLRGGGEYGEDWYRAGTLTEKQNVFDDFIAAAEFLIDRGYTSPDNIGIFGGSNGGLLVAACMLQRPDLFGAAVPAVGVLDMLRYHKFTIGRAWATDYGVSDDPEKPEQFEALMAYSPVHNVEAGVAYPPTMITTGDYDDRVVPAHSFKFAAALQAGHGGDAPVLIRVEEDAGHGAGKPISKIIEERADIWAFFAEHLGLELEGR